MYKDSLKAIGLLWGFGLLIIGCCNKPEFDPDWENPLSSEVYEKYLERYVAAGYSIASAEVSGKQSIYVDFSDGLYQAYATPTNQKVIDYLSQKLVGSSIDWYGMGRNFNGIGKLRFQNDRDLYNQVKDPASYVDLMAPIEKALEQIVKGKNDALLITDFEEYTPDGQEQKYAFEKKYFTEWVKNGNSITFYYSPFQEVNAKTKLSSDKNLYFVIFNYGSGDGEDCLKKKFELAIEQRDVPELKKLEINPHPYKISTNYGGDDKNGLSPDEQIKSELELNDKAQVLLSFSNFFNSKHIPLEAFGFSVGLGELHQYYFQDDKVFLKNLFLDASDTRLYSLKSAIVKVTDMSDDFEHFVKCKIAAKQKPTLIRDEEKNLIWDEKTTKNDIITTCFQLNTKELKPSYVYAARAGSEMSEILELDNDIFKGHLKNAPNEIELKTLFHRNFNADKLDGPAPRILKVEMVLDKVEPTYSNQLDDFKWTSIINKNNGVNESLYESVRNTIQDVRPEGVLYTYLLRMEGKE